MAKASINFGSNIYISTGHAFSNCGGLALAVSGTYGRILGETEKAFEVHADTERGNVVKFWVPKKALVKATRDEGSSAVRCELAHWFKPAGWTARAMDLSTRHSVLCG